MIIEFDTNNSAFDNSDGLHGRAEIARILRNIADKVEEGRVDGSIRDINGNRVGNWKLNDND